jgi:predicted small secreted protein
MKNVSSTWKRLLLLLAFTAVLGNGAVACKNTVHGAGQDIENAGQKIQEKTQ